MTDSTIVIQNVMMTFAKTEMQNAMAGIVVHANVPVECNISEVMITA